MNTTPAWRRYLRFWRPNHHQDVAVELAFHIEMRVEEYIERGMTEDDARRAVGARLGDVAAAHAECIHWGEVRMTHARRARFIDGLRSDVHYALRSLRRVPAWTTVALITIALGVGATTTVFSVADTLLVRTLPYPNAARVYLAQRQFTIGSDRAAPVSVPFGTAKIWREHARTIEAAALASGDGSGTLLTTNDSMEVNIAHAEREFFALAGARPLIGRIPASDEITSDAHLMFLTEELWRAAFGAASDVVGRSAKVRGEDWTIVGVLPTSVSIPDFRSQRADIFQLTTATERAFGPVLVRLKPGVTREAATAELGELMKNANLPDVRPGPMPLQFQLTRPQDWLPIRQPLVMLTAAVGLLLLVACTNVAHLLLARGVVRQRELAVRHVLGAGRTRLVRQLVTESVVLAVVGGVLAVFVAWTGLHVLLALRPDDRAFNALTYISPNRGVIAIASVLAIGSGFLVGIVAALRNVHRDLAIGLRVGAGGTMHRARRLRSSLVVGEVAVSATLLVGALLLVHSLFALEHTDVGFDARGLYGITVPAPRGMLLPDRAALAATMLERLSHVPGVESAVITDRVPGGPGFTALGVWETPDRPRSPEEAKVGAAYYTVPSEFFAKARMPLLAGRTFDAGSAARNEIIVSRSLANEIAGGVNPIGLRIRNAVARARRSNAMMGGASSAGAPADEPWQIIVGVVPDLITNLTQATPTGALFRPLSLIDTLAGTVPTSINILVRDNEAGAAARLARLAASVGAVPNILSVRDAIDASLVEPRYAMRVLIGLASLGVMLAAVGLVGVISYSVSQRTREIGVRMALGATRFSIARLVVADGVKLAAIGVALGLVGALAMTRLVQGVIHGVSRFDPVAFAGGTVLLLIIAAVACIGPTLRATAIDPALAVRVE